MGRRHKRRHRRHRAYRQRRKSGWGMGLYRNTQDGKIAGVCAGIADHWEVEHWVVRLLAVVLFLFTGTLAIWAYVAGWIMLAPKRRDADYTRWEDDAGVEDTVEMEYDERHHDYRPRKMFRYGESASVRLNRAQERLDVALHRVEDMESYVTSRQYKLNQEFSKL
jgi:phage shock protein C